MEIPYTVSTRSDTGLWNAKVGIWLFLASEVMLFGGLFSAYIFLRLDAEPGYWPHGLLNVPVGTFNMAIMILCGVIFLVVKLGYEWPQKYDHFGAYIKTSELEKYERYLGNKHL